jgi:hypothetical protein
MVSKELFLVHTAYGGGCAKYRLAERMVLPEILSEQFVDEYVGIVLVNLDLLQDYSPLALNVSGGKYWIKNEIGEHVQRHRNMFGQRLHIEANSLLADCHRLNPSLVRYAALNASGFL